MKRLFISLYLLLCLSVLSIGWALDNLWHTSIDNSEQQDPVNAPLIALAKLFALLPEDERRDYLAKINQTLDYRMRLLNSNKVALANRDRLSSESVLVTVNSKDSERYFIKVDDQHILMMGPVEIDPKSNLRTSLTLLFYASLALVVYIWVWPLSRDLKRLKRATAEFGQAKWDTQISLPPRSQVQPLARTFNEMARHIRALIENQKYLSSAVSHEIRTPLARLKFAIALLPQYCRPETDVQRREQFLDEMKQDVQEMEDLLEELLTYASLESQRKTIAMGPCELIQLTAQTIGRLQVLNSTPIQFLPKAERVEIIGDPALIERALQNLVINAQRFAKEAIRVEVIQDETMATLSVIDDGPGISKEEQQQIFKPFYRSQTEQNSAKGHGLGLAIIERIMERHSGSVTLSSQLGLTQFSLHWPLARQNEN
ncbi:ATP-binding protein [Shewanella sp. AS1]|uniref:ATP-binding protein n=1 Tax=Shewanella sp. AS1 TaxID=2907626 RepID=UPI001F1577DA|nr:ATP-binding protein [Shewanella sp. AS1]MCE9677869.1 ATP-binding protein [Shewanella sp. AS1]